MFSIGSGHNPHVARRNIDMTIIIMDNKVYGLTKNQLSPTSRDGQKGMFHPYGNIDGHVNPIMYMLTFGATYVAQTYAGNLKHMVKVIKEAIAHKGLSFVNVISPCPTFNKFDTYKYYKDHIIDINEDLGHTELDNFNKAMEMAIHWDDNYKDPMNAKAHIGVYYKVEKPTYHDRVKEVQEKYGYEPNIQNLIDVCKPKAI
jgi:2-oxoglutarate ferredoxin oxidoreductase subunit beta